MTDEELKTWIYTNYRLCIHLTSGKDHGILNALTPQLKRIAALGDGVFQAPRRWMLLPENPNVWFFYMRLKLLFWDLSISCHSSDLLHMFVRGELAGYLIQHPRGTGTLKVTLDRCPCLSWT